MGPQSFVDKSRFSTPTMPLWTSSTLDELQKQSSSELEDLEVAAIMSHEVSRKRHEDELLKDLKDASLGEEPEQDVQVPEQVFRLNTFSAEHVLLENGSVQTPEVLRKQGFKQASPVVVRMRQKPPKTRHFVQETSPPQILRFSPKNRRISTDLGCSASKQQYYQQHPRHSINEAAVCRPFTVRDEKHPNYANVKVNTRTADLQQPPPAIPPRFRPPPPPARLHSTREYQNLEQKAPNLSVERSSASQYRYQRSKQVSSVCLDPRRSNKARLSNVFESRFVPDIVVDENSQYSTIDVDVDHLNPQPSTSKQAEFLQKVQRAHHKNSNSQNGQSSSFLGYLFNRLSNSQRLKNRPKSTPGIINGQLFGYSVKIPQSTVIPELFESEFDSVR